MGLKVSAYATLSILVVLSFVLASGTQFSLWVALCTAAYSVWIVQRSRRAGTRPRLIQLFFWAAAGHAVFGYWAAGNSTEAIWIGSNAEQMFRRSLLTISGTLLVAAFTYDIAPGFPTAWARRLGRRLSATQEDRLISAARCLALLGIFCVVYLIVTIGFMPLLAPDPGQARYIFTEMGPAYEHYDWVRLRGLELLACSLPLVLFSGLVYRKKLDLFIGALGASGILITLQRGTLISVFIVLMVIVTFVKGKLPRRYIAYVAVLLIGYFASQLIYLNAMGKGFDSGGARIAVLSALPEVRDLGWVMSVTGDQRFYGVTFLVPIVPGPNFATEFKQRYGLGYLTIRLMGLQEGLRITLPGEGYLNFGAIGFLVVGTVLGMLCASLGDLSGRILTDRDLTSSYVIAVWFSWLCFWLYLGGTANAGTIKFEVIDIFAMLFFARPRALRPNKLAAAIP
jgi:hypothetical protein